jgi:sigma-B regulation protein RsbU (phosphoserine phosphatase)
MGSMAVNLLLIVGMIFLAIELAALIAGIILTRAITTSVDNLYLATRHAQSGDLSFRVPLRQRDELGALGDSFNSMMQSVSTLIEEQRERQRLENELAIAREVQTQLFPPELPSMPGVELEAICRPARMVSGDYYDFIRIGPTRLAIVLADISGKGISAALLMASLQATLRAELLRDVENNPGREPFIPNTAKIVAHLNRHLFLSTSEERYATLFLAVYDTRTRRLSYTNAGHLPPFYLYGDSMQRLETGDTVIGLFSDVEFRQSTLNVAPDGLLVIYSDGLTEPENGAGEAFGASRLAEIAMRLRTESPRVVAQSMLSAAERWSVGRAESSNRAQPINSDGNSNGGSNSGSNGGSNNESNSEPPTRPSEQPAEQADDMTVVVARLSSPDLRADATEPSTTKSLIEN